MAPAQGSNYPSRSEQGQTRMPSNPFRSAQFVLSAPEPRQLPADDGAEVAFAGRSNAGKSSALNAICDQTGLARTSKTPGRTQLLNVFVLDDGRRLIDLPGYGYAKVPDAVRDRWRRSIDVYLRERESLRGLVLIVDSRHPLKEFDRQMLAYCNDVGLACHILLTKADKLSRSEATRTLAAVRKECTAQGWPATAQLFSVLAKTGFDEARAALAALLARQSSPPVSTAQE
jgi:GTP-binding protein